MKIYFVYNKVKDCLLKSGASKRESSGFKTSAHAKVALNFQFSSKYCSIRQSGKKEDYKVIEVELI